MLRWFEEPGEADDVIISNRICLVRNIKAYPFSAKITTEQTEKMLAQAGKVLIKLPQTSKYRDYLIEELDDIQKSALVERNVITDCLAKQNKAMFFVSEDEKNSIMLNEEEHICIQCVSAGTNLEETYQRACRLDDSIGEKIEYAYDDNFGYLTTCLSNVGTGMKAAYVMHLPALGNSKKMQELMAESAKFGIEIKGLYGEDGSGRGHIYQISNQRTLGLSEEDIISNITNIAGQISAKERECRKNLLKTDRLQVEDQIYKSYGVLKYSRKQKYKDAMLLLSEVRLGMVLGVLQFQVGIEKLIYQLMIGIQPGNLKSIAGRELSEVELDELRAEFIRDNLPLLN